MLYDDKPRGIAVDATLRDAGKRTDRGLRDTRKIIIPPDLAKELEVRFKAGERINAIAASVGLTESKVSRFCKQFRREPLKPMTDAERAALLGDWKR